MAVVCATTGQKGTGKTYMRGPVFLCSDRGFLLTQPTAHYFTNFPLHVDKIGEYMEKKTGRPAKEFTDRIHIIPGSILTSWAQGKSGPWEYLEAMPEDWKPNVVGSHWSLDEAHKFCGKHHKAKHRMAWQGFLSEVRKEGMTWEMITQSWGKMAREIEIEIGLRLNLVSNEDRRDWLFNIPMSDWYNLVAKFTGHYVPALWEIERREVDGKWKTQETRKYDRTPEFFPLFNSWAKADGKTSRSFVSDKEYTKRTHWGIVKWFALRNSWNFGSRIGACVLVMWVCFFGGSTTLLRVWLWAMPLPKTAPRVAKAPTGQPPKHSATRPATQPRSTVAHSLNDGGATTQPSTQPAATIYAEAPAPQPPVVIITAIGNRWAALKSGRVVRIGSEIKDLGRVEKIKTEDRCVIIAGRTYWLAQ